MMGGRNEIAETADGMKGVTNGLKCERIVNEPLMKKDIY